MRIYFSGVGGAGVGPAMKLAKDLGYSVAGSDLHASQNTDDFKAKRFEIYIGQDGSQINQAQQKHSIDLLVHTPALPEDHAELEFARENNIEISSVEGFVNKILKEKNLKLIAISGTHGKTTTTGLLIWLFKYFEKPLSYLLGTTLSWSESGQFQTDSEYFVIEADEYDKKFLQFKPYLSVIPSIEYDHPDTYKDEADYEESFKQFIGNSHCSYLWRDDANHINLELDLSVCAHIFGAEEKVNQIKLAGEHNRLNAFLSAQAFKDLFADLSWQQIVNAINEFPGTNRRFEKLGDNIYSDYAHHPSEIEATLQLAREKTSSIVAVYQPHQNVRQKHILDNGGYGNCFREASHVFWLNTYLTREDPDLEVIEPSKLVDSLSSTKNVEVIDDPNSIVETINNLRKTHMVVVMGAGDIDAWARKNFT